MRLKQDQEKAFFAIKRFVDDIDQKVFILRGYAGTGKTTMMRILIDELAGRDISCVLLASTGRAAKILSNSTGRTTSTVHGQIYSYKGLNQDLETVVADREKNEVDKTGQLLLNFSLDARPFDDMQTGNNRKFYIVDEASMISDLEDANATQAVFGSGKLLADLLNYDPCGKFIFVGDVCQLPPVGQQFSPALSIQYMQDNYRITPAFYELHEIIRQDSGNGIIESSKKIRDLFHNNPSRKWVKFPMRGYANIEIHEDRTALLRSYIDCIRKNGYNHGTLISQSNKNCLTLTELIRPALNLSNKKIQEKDLLLVTQNNYITGLMNGDMVQVVSIGIREQVAGLTFVKVEVEELFTKKCHALLMMEDIVYGNGINLSQPQQKELFIDFFLRMKRVGISQKHHEFSRMMMSDPYLNALRAVYGYALTCHKSQGGEWDEVYLDIGKGIQAHDRPAVYQWIYTAMTRARKKLHVVGDWWIE